MQYQALGGKSKAQRGTTLLLSLAMMLVGSIVVSSFLFTLTQEYQVTHRSYYHGTALYVAESGIEEALAMMNYGGNNWAASGWSDLGGSINYTKTVTNLTDLGSSSIIGTYAVSILGISNNHPVAVCTGIVNCASASIRAASNTNIVRVVRATLAPRPVFQWGLLAQNRVNLNGNNISIDSFDSSDPNYSDYDVTDGFGTYDLSKKKDNGDIASNAGVTNTISVGNAEVYGHVNTGPGGTVSVGPNGFVAGLGQATNGVIDSGRVSHSMSVDLPAATLPGNWSPAGNLGNITGSSTINGGAGSPIDWDASGISMSGGDYIRFNSGYTRVHVTGNISVSGNATIIVEPDAVVEFYVAGTTFIAGNGVANNDERALSFQLYSLGSGDVSVSGNGQLVAVLYAPQSNVTFSGGGGSGGVVGAIVGNTINLGGHVQFHYDENLENTGPIRGYSVMSWQEL